MDFPFTFRRLTEDRLDIAVALCDACVGENLYPRAYIASILHDPAHFFYLLETPEGEAVGYCYSFLTDLETLAAYTKLPRATLAAASSKENPAVANLRSMGVVKEWRNRGLSDALARFHLEHLRSGHAVDIVFGVLWKVSSAIPMGKTLQNLGFTYLADAHHVWYDEKDLVCPYCEGPCECDAAVYYKDLSGEGIK